MCCYFDTETRKSEFINATTERNYLTTLLKKYPASLIVMEACGPSGWIHDLCVELKLKTLVCSTNEDAWKWSNVKRKTDRDDALKLARMAASHELQAVHIPVPKMRELRAQIKFRKAIVRRMNRIKNSIRSIFVNQGISIERSLKLWTTERSQIDSHRKAIDKCLPCEFWKGQLDTELTQLDALAQQRDAMDKTLDAIGKQDPRIQRLQTIPGVGPRTAEVLVAAIDDPKRFKNGRQVSAYFGLVPKQYQSGETDRNGRISKRGPSLVRASLVECAWLAIRYNEWAKKVYARIYGKQKTRKKKAAVALARKIAVVAWAMLRDETDWSPEIMERITALGRKKSKEPTPTMIETTKPTSNAVPENAKKEVAFGDKTFSELIEQGMFDGVDSTTQPMPQRSNVAPRKASAPKKKNAQVNSRSTNKGSVKATVASTIPTIQKPAISRTRNVPTTASKKVPLADRSPPKTDRAASKRKAVST
jgi:transposase